MARISISPEISAFVADRIEKYSVKATEQYQLWEAPDVANFAALPLIRHWFETIGLRADGEIVESCTDNLEPFSGVRPVEDRYSWLSALVEGARRYPVLSALLPVRRPDAEDCWCVDNPHFSHGKLLCPDCCGLGWK